MKNFIQHKTLIIKWVAILLGIVFLLLNQETQAQVISNNGTYISISGGTVVGMDTINNDNAATLTNAGTINIFTINNAGITQGNGTYNIAGSFTNTGTFLSGTGTINLDGTSAQMIAGFTFNNLTLNNSNGVTMLGNITVSNTLSQTLGNLTIGSNTLTINGSVSGSSGTLTGSSTSNLTVNGAAGILNFTGGTSLNNLTLASTASATLGTALIVYGNINTNINGALNLANLPLTLKSNSTNTASIDQLAANGLNLTGATNVTVERWIPLRQNIPLGGRAYRVLTPTVTSTTSIAANWMEGGMNTVVGTNTNPMPLHGLQISGAGGNAGGFDVTQTNAPSLYTFTPGSNINSNIGYPAVTNVGAGSTLNALTGYFLYTRGDRSTSMQVNYNPAGGMPTSATTLRANGAVQKGTIGQTISNVNNNFTLITNPYPAPIDWQAISTANTNIANAYTYWNPNSGIEGAFVTVAFAGSPRYIQPGQAFFVQSNAGGASVTITEAMKAVGQNDNGPFFTNTAFESFSVELLLTESNNIKHTADGVMVMYNNSYSTGIDAFDAEEINNWKENIAISSNATRLSIESRPVISTKDTIFLYMNHMRQTNYEFEFTPSLFTNTGLVAELVDNYLNTRTLLSVTSTVNVTFTVNADAGSSATNRFMIVFGSAAGPLPIDVITINAQAKNAGIQVDWSSKTETNMDRYEVERSANGTQFTSFKTTAAIGNSPVPVNYSWFDATPLTGNNFYRIKAFDKNGAFKYSQVVTVTIGKGQPAITVTPNPVTNNELGLKLTNMDKGTYSLVLYNSAGQLVFSTQVQHTGGSVYKPIALGKALAGGTYQLLFTGDNGVKITTRIIVAN